MRTLKMLIVLIYSLLWTLPFFPKIRRLQGEHRTEELRSLLADMGRQWGRMLVEASGSTVTVEGAERIPQDQAVVVVANHQGYFDIPVLLGYFPKPAAYIAKAGVRKVPILGALNAYYGTVFIERGNPREALKAIQQGVQRIQEGQSLVIFPEGTRSPDGHLLPFKPGALKLAQKSKAPIVPVTLVNTRGIMAKGGLSIRKADIRILIGDPIAPDTEGSVDLAELIQAQIAGNLEKWQAFGGRS